MLDDYLKLLQSRYNYSDDLIQCLAKIIPALIQYYGENYQSNILNALYNCEIHIQKDEETPAEYLNQYFVTNERWSAPI